MSVTRLDFLNLRLAAGPSIARVGARFEVRKPWAMALYGEQRFAPGWWKLECEGEADPAAVEVRLTSSTGAFVIFAGAQAKDYCVHLGGEAIYDVALLVSPWPSQPLFSVLRLRRLNAAEEAAFLFHSGTRVLSRQRSPTQILQTLKRLSSGQAVGVRATNVQRATTSERLKIFNSQTPQPYVVFREGIVASLYKGDILHSRAFDIVTAAFNADPGLRVIYADALEAGVIIAKPDWDPELASHVDYAGAPVFFRESGHASSWDHVRRIGSSYGPKAIHRIALPLVSRGASFATRLPSLPAPKLDHAPSASIIIPTKLRIDLLEKCLTGLATRTDYSNFEVIIMDNGCEDPRLGDLIAAASFSVQRVTDVSPFNFSQLNNRAVERAQGDIVLLLNDDIEPIEPSWLIRIVTSAIESNVGAVGARLLYPDRTIQHAGVAMGLGGVCGHLWKGRTEGQASRIPHIVYPGTRMAVTAACLAVRRDLYRSVGGLDEAYPVALNDIDFCLRLHTMGMRNIYRGDAVLIHHESQSRGLDDLTAEKRRRLGEETSLFLSRWKHLVRDDPYGSPAFDVSLQSGAVHPSLLKDWR